MLKRLLLFGTFVAAMALALFIIFKPEPYKPITCYSINDIKKYIEPNCLVVADFDNTLFECVDQNQGSDQWFDASMKYVGNFEKVLNLYRKAHETALIKPVESSTIPFLQLLEKSKTKFLVLTARSIIPQTFRELENVQESPVKSFSFQPFALNGGELKFDLEKGAALYKQGIFFCGNNNKGEVLIALLNKLEIKPTSVIFIDDKEKNVIAVAQAMKKHKIPFVGLRYAYLDKKVEQYHLDKESLKLNGACGDLAMAQ